MSSGRSEGVVRNSGMSKTEKTDKPDKKPFDKKKWRENKYSNKVKVQKFEDQREKSMKRKYFRMLKKEGSNSNPNLVPLGGGKSKLEQKSLSGPSKISYKKAKEDFERRQKAAEKAQKREERKEMFLEKQAAIKAFKDKKAERNRVLSLKTKKGQPLLSGRMAMILEKIRSQES